MDGTLLDLHYDNHFWLEHLPARYATEKGLSYAQAREELLGLYREAEGTLDWYCLDYWTARLGMDIALLKEEVDHLIALHPFVVEFLDVVRAAGRRRVLVTNAHGKSLDLKLRRTPLGGHLDALVCAHDLGLPKENPAFWERLQGVEPFDPRHTLLVDDSLPVLRSARSYGIAQLLAVRRPDTHHPPREITEFEAIGSFLDIMPSPISLPEKRCVPAGSFPPSVKNGYSIQ
jgi:putative hydrolase of the HAD superfamily